MWGQTTCPAGYSKAYDGSVGVFVFRDGGGAMDNIPFGDPVCASSTATSQGFLCNGTGSGSGCGGWTAPPAPYLMIARSPYPAEGTRCAVCTPTAP